MLGNEISDYRQLKALRAKMETPEFKKEKFILKSLYHCGKKVPIVNGSARVALLANDKTAKFVGVASCKSSWGCPVCTAKQMAKYGSRIASALDALKERSMSAAMITFTIPHTAGFSCEQATEILYNTWKAFTIHGNKIGTSYANDIFANFCATFDSKHRVRVTEYTWGKNGWHPHFHTLFWFPASKIQQILDWEERLKIRWLELAKRYSVLEFLSGYPETQIKTVRTFILYKIDSYNEFEDAATIREQLFKLRHSLKAEEISDEFCEALADTLYRFQKMYSNLNSVSNAVYISKKERINEKTAALETQVIIQESAQYLTGWGADLELTGNAKNVASHTNHYTWQQILANAIKQDEMKLNELQPAEGSRKKEESEGAEQEPNWWKLYFEYMEATRKQRHARVNFSVQSGLNDIIKEYRKTHAYKEILKKNHMDRKKNFGVWRTVCFFNKSQWSSICNNDLEVRILELATANNAINLIAELLEIYQIPPPIENKAEAEKLEQIWNAA